MRLQAVLRSCVLALGLAWQGGFACAADGNASYKIAPGDVLSLSVVGVPELTARLPIGVDGRVSVPLIGQVAIADQTLEQARASLQQLMPTNAIHRTTSDGSSYNVVINAADIGLSIEEYRPITINGDVAKPGEQPFRPGMTVRRAVAGAGGYDILRFKMDNPFLQLSDLTSEYQSLWINYARQQAALARLTSELDDKPALDTGSLLDTPISKSLSAEILDNERRQLELDTLDFQKEQDYLKTASAHEAERSQVLSEQQAKETEGAETDVAELKRYQALYKKGSVTEPTVAEARRTALLSATRELQTIALLASVQREAEDLNRRLDRLGDTRRLEVLRNQQEVTSQMAQTRAKLQAVSEKLRYAGMVKSQLVRGLDSDPVVFILRDGGDKSERIPADLDARLQPGDTVEIVLQIAEGPVQR